MQYIDKKESRSSAYKWQSVDKRKEKTLSDKWSKGDSTINRFVIESYIVNRRLCWSIGPTAKQKMFHNGNNELFRTVPNSASSSSSSFDDIISTSTTNKTTTGSEITTDDIYGLCNGTAQRKETPISQFASRVLEFSSQYGSDNSISYTACNITGRPSKFPNYGDFPETFAMVSEHLQIIYLVTFRKVYSSVLMASIGLYFPVVF